VITVATFPELAMVGRLVQVREVIAVKRTGTATFEAFDMTCTHQGCVVDITDGQRFDCPCHFSSFANDGSVTRGPASQPLRRKTTSYDPDTDQLTIS
jgi:Rieske Fe-S protein